MKEEMHARIIYTENFSSGYIKCEHVYIAKRFNMIEGEGITYYASNDRIFILKSFGYGADFSKYLNKVREEDNRIL